METKIVELLSDNTALPVLFIGSGLSRRYLDLPDWEGLLKQYCVKPFEYYNDKAVRACRDNPEMRLPTAADYIEEDFNEHWYIDDAYAESRETHRVVKVVAMKIRTKPLPAFVRSCTSSLDA